MKIEIFRDENLCILKCDFLRIRKLWIFRIFHPTSERSKVQK